MRCSHGPTLTIGGQWTGLVYGLDVMSEVGVCVVWCDREVGRYRM